MEECLFCKIAKKEVFSSLVYEDDNIVAFPDINPKAPTHLLIIPRKHIPSLAHLSEAESPIVGHMAKVAHQLASNQGVAESGYRLVINCGKEGGQLVPHLHLHLLGGRQMGNRLG